MGLIVPRRFNGSTSQCVYAANATQDLTAQTWMTTCISPNVGTGTQYLFGHCDSGALNGVRIQQLGSGNALRFGADSTGTANAPHKSTSAGSVQSNVLYNFAATWDGVSLNANSITLYISSGGAPIALALATLPVDGTTALRSNTVNQPLVIGNRTGGSRTWNGDIHFLWCWRRILTLEELQKAQRYGAASVPQGLVLDWHDGRDWSVNALTCPTIVALNPGVTSPFVAPTRKRRPRYFFGPGAAEAAMMGQACL